ncbi:methyltransferase domain protein [Rhizoctonia solani]|uniref:Methyltransferase domain protein n=1 Tax=Rhizoctonia solani TaxID=456999 RepID=A0A8H8NR59_9AGAM|nr:methyltransferase domain protein [Rhizoctonia solani]QRW17272.1 methyltransferase domain protein [Rhizoctonia solani]
MAPDRFEVDDQPYTYDGTEGVVYHFQVLCMGYPTFLLTIQTQTPLLYAHNTRRAPYLHKMHERISKTWDEQESRRLDHEHFALKLVLGRNYVGPVASHLRHDPMAPRKRVLDIGTQQGTWVQEMASEFPHVEFVSLDFSPMAAHIPPDASFDMVHVGNYQFLIQELYRVLRPGGLLISGEFENETYGADNPNTPLGDASPRLSRALAFVRQALAAQGVTVDAGRQLPDMLNDSKLFPPISHSTSPDFSSESDSDDSRGTFSSTGTCESCVPGLSTSHTMANLTDTGFVDVTPSTFYIPATPWPDPCTHPHLYEAGCRVVIGIQHGWPSLVPLLTAHAGLSTEDARDAVTGAVEERFVDLSLKHIMKFHTVWAYKVQGTFAE